jgi:mannose-6-phosphate isomerase-like protein (cupin superfamily)
MHESDGNTRYLLADFGEVEAVRCPCGWARRAFGGDARAPASVHRVEIEADSKTHFHKVQTEIYFVLEGEGHIELDDETVALRPGVAVTILPGCRHRAVGRLTILNVVVPPFDKADEYVVGEDDETG